MGVMHKLLILFLLTIPILYSCYEIGGKAHSSSSEVIPDSDSDPEPDPDPDPDPDPEEASLADQVIGELKSNLS